MYSFFYDFAFYLRYYNKISNTINSFYRKIIEAMKAITPLSN